MSFKNILTRVQLRNAIAQMLKQYATGTLLDVGCGTKQYAKLAAPYVTQHVGLDHPQTLHGINRVDVVATAYNLPFGDFAVDTVLCTEVLEHLEEPELALKEFARVLRPGGTILITAPFIWHIHEEPRDFFRYTCYGLDYLAKRAGLHVLDVRPLNGFWVTWAQLLVYVIYGYNKGPLRFIPVIPLLGLLLQGCGLLMDKIDKRPRWASHHVAVFQKPNDR